MKKQTIYVLLATVLISLTTSCKAIKVYKAISAGDVVNTEFNTNIDFEYTGHINIIATINGVEKRFMVDTGAGINVISKELQEELGIKTQFNFETGDGLNSQNTEWLKINTINIDGIDIKDSFAFVQDFTESGEFYCMGIDGIIGSNILSKMNIKIDYENEILNLSNLKGKEDDYTKTHDFEFPFEVRNLNTPVVKFDVNNRIYKATFDTGYPYALMHDYKILDSVSKPYSYLQGRTQIRIKGASIDTMYLYKNPPFKIGNLEPKESMVIGNTLEEGGALIGNDLLKDYIVYVNNDHNMIYLDKNNADKILDEPSRNYKIGFAYENKEIILSVLMKDSKLSKVPLGSKLISLNLKNYETPSLNDFCEVNTLLENHKSTLEIVFLNALTNTIEHYSIDREKV